MNVLVVHKVGSLSLMFVLSLLSGLLPMKIRKLLVKSSSSEKFVKGVLSGSLCFGAGVLMATVFLHILKETREKFEDLMASGTMSHSEYPFTELVLCVGFFLIYFIEEVVHLVVSKKATKNDTDHLGHCHLRRASSITLQRIRSIDASKQLSTKSKPNSENNPEKGEMVNLNIASIGKPTYTVNEGKKAPRSNQETCTGAQKHDSSSEPKEVQITRGILVVLALSIHGAFEGLSLGLEDNVSSVWLLFVALSAHKIFIGFSIGMELQEVGVQRILYISHILIFSLASPIGGCLGSILKESFSTESPVSRIVVAVLQGVSGGTILYVTFCEVLERERNKPGGRFIRLLSLMSGFLIMAGLEVFGVKYHSHHSHHEDHQDHLINEGHSHDLHDYGHNETSSDLHI